MQIIADNHWSESNRDLHAFWPRLSASSISNNVQQSTHWLRNGDFVRLKSLEIGYTLPRKLTSKVHLQSMRLYVSGNNLFVWSNLNGIRKWQVMVLVIPYRDIKLVLTLIFKTDESYDIS